LALLGALVVSALTVGRPQSSPTAARADARVASHGDSRPAIVGPGVVEPTGCPLAAAPAGYVNPLAGARLKPERIDQGVDYAGSGTLAALGAGRITNVARTGTGWPGAFIEYQLLTGADAGCYVFYAEGVIPVEGLRAGQPVSAGQPIATVIPHYPTGIEVGWGAGISTKAYAKVNGQWSAADDHDNVATAAGKSFSALVAALGGPAGKVEG
jgi:murein DD-endopeptidase MepM/ murein hydrolase activator NlpD